MAPTNKSIEILQKQVDEVRTGLDSLKSETDETLRQQKAKETTEKLKLTKEDVNKKLEELKALGEAANKSEIEKLEAMLVSLDSLSTLQDEIIKNNNTPTPTNEKIDTSADFESVRGGIEEMKTMAVDLQAIIDAYNKQKSTMNEADKATKEKEIQDKKTEIENKRKEIQSIIDKIKKAWADVKFDDITDETVKTALKEQKKTEEATLASYQKSLNAINTPASTFMEKVKNGANKMGNRVVTNPRATAGIVAGGIVLIGWISGWFKRKEKKEGDENKKEGFRDHGFGKFLKKALIVSGIGLGVRGLYKLIFGEKKPEISGTLRNVESAVKSFEDVKDPKTKENLNTVGTGVNTFFDSIDKFNDGSLPSDVDSQKLGTADLDKYTGVIPHIIDNSYTDIGHFTSESGLAWLSIDSTVDDITKTFADMISKGLESVVSFVLGTAGFSGVNISMDKVKTFLAGKNSKEKTIKLRQEIYKTFTYTKFVENAYVSKTIYDYVKAGNILYKRSNSEGNREAVTISNPEELLDGNLIGKMQLDPENYKINEVMVDEIQKNVRGMKLKDIPSLGITQVDMEKFNTPLYAKLKEYNDERDAKRTAVDTDKKGTLEKMKEHVGDDLADSFWESARKSLPLLQLFGGDADRAKKAFRSISGYKDLLTKYQTKFEKLKTEPDMKKVKDEVDKYYCTLKELATMQYAIEKAVDENGNAGVSIVGRFTAFFEGCWNHVYLGITEITNPDGVGDIFAGLFNVGIGGGSLFSVYYAIRHPMKTGRFVLKNVGNAVQTGASMLGRNVAYRDIMPDKWLVKYYEKNGRYLSYDYITGRMSTTKANGVLNAMNRTNSNIFDYLKGQGILGTSNQDEIAMFLNKNKSFLENNEIKKALFFKDRKRSDRMKNRKGVKISLENNIYENLKTLRSNIDGLKPNQTRLCERIIEKAKIGKKTDDIKNFFTKMEEFTKSDGLKSLDIEKLSTKEIYDLADRVGKNMDDFSTADEINAYIKTLKNTVNTTTTATLDIFKLADAAEAKTSVAYKLSEQHPGGKTDDIVKKFESNEYKDYECLAEDGTKSSFKAEYTKLNGDTGKLQKLDYAYAEKLWNEQDAAAKTILEELHTEKLGDFTTKIESRISEITKQESLIADNVPGRLAKKSIETQRNSLKDMEKLATSMTEPELNGLKTLYTNIKSVDGCMDAVADTWKAATKDADLMKALTEGDAKALEKFTKKVPQVEKVIKLFEKEGKNAEKILAGGLKFEESLESLLKAFFKVLK